MTKLFHERPINDLFKIVEDKVLNEIKGYSEIETAEPEKLTEIIMQRFKFNVPVIDFDNKIATPDLEKRQGSLFPPSSFANPNLLYPVAVVNYSVPYTGNSEIFTAQPNRFTDRTYVVDIDNNFIHFKVDAEYATLDLPDENIKKIKEKINEIAQWINSNLELLRHDCTAYENELRKKILVEIRRRIETVNNLKDLGNRLNQDI